MSHNYGESSNYVVNIDPCINWNGANHKTYQYDHMRRPDSSSLVVRRGQEFKLIITFRQVYDKDRDSFAFSFKCRDNNRYPSYKAGTLAAIILNEEPGNGVSWSAAIEQVSGNTVVVNLKSPPTCTVGIWDLEIIIGQKYIYKWHYAIYILFNPWCEYDDVYMQSDEWKAETVLDSRGLIWTSLRSNPLTWNYSQFERDVLDCSIYLITAIGGLSAIMRSNPVAVSTTLSAVVNDANNNNGVVVGNWSNNFANGRPPSYWTGSGEILQQYYATKRPVRYGQCWVFAGVLTSVCRALGIPSRTITNFSSAHDTDSSLTIDIMIDMYGKKLNDDSIWNFHAWTEAWMKRPDMVAGFDGWQVIDATPQELSNGRYKLGPASVSACKQGAISAPYDLQFVFSEVNADILYWAQDALTGQWRLTTRDTRSVGQNISTKAPGSYSRLDVTHTYKYPEGSREERTVYENALRYVNRAVVFRNTEIIFDNIKFTFEHLDDVLIGKNFSVSLRIDNQKKDIDYTLDLVFRVDIKRYTGKFLGSVKYDKQTVEVRGGNSNNLSLNVSYDDYRKYVEDNCFLEASCLANVNGTNEQYFDVQAFQLEKPNVDIELQPIATGGKTVVGKVKLTNPLSTSLTNGQFIINVPGLHKPIIINVLEEIQPQQTVIRSFKFDTDEPGNHAIGAKFISTELHDCTGFHTFDVNH